MQGHDIPAKLPDLSFLSVQVVKVDPMVYTIETNLHR